VEPIVKSGKGKHLSDALLIHNGLKQGDALTPLLSNYASEYAIGNKEGLELNWSLLMTLIYWMKI
jgi:hypothetical protein